MKRRPFLLVTSHQRIVSENQFWNRGSKHGTVTEGKSCRGEEKHILLWASRQFSEEKWLKERIPFLRIFICFYDFKTLFKAIFKFCTYHKIFTHIYIYILSSTNTVSFYQNSSVWLDTQDAWSRDRNPSNFTLD